MRENLILNYISVSATTIVTLPRKFSAKPFAREPDTEPRLCQCNYHSYAAEEGFWQSFYQGTLTTQGPKAATTQRRNAASTQRRNDATTQGRKGARAQGRKGARAQRCNNAATPQRCNAATPQRRNDATAQRRSDATTQRRCLELSGPCLLMSHSTPSRIIAPRVRSHRYCSPVPRVTCIPPAKMSGVRSRWLLKP